MRIADLKAFVTLGDLSSFHSAAEHLNITQPALSRRIQKLEERLEVPLFTRTTRQVHLTAAGRDFLERARKIVLETEDSIASLRDASSNRRELIRIGCLPSLGLKLIPEVIAQFRQLYPFVAFRVLDMNAIQLVEEVARGSLDVGIGMLPATNPEVEFRLLAKESLGVVCNRAHPVAEQPDLCWNDLKEYPMAYNIQQSGNWLKIQRTMENEHIRLNWFHQIQSILGALMMVRKGDGLAVVPRCSIEALCIPDLIFREVSSPDIYREIGILTRSSSLQSLYVREVIELVRKQFPE